MTCRCSIDVDGLTLLSVMRILNSLREMLFSLERLVTLRRVVEGLLEQ